METFKRKIKNIFSRKFIISAVIVAGGIGTALKAVNDPTVQIAGIIVACVASVFYTLIEGVCDISSIDSEIDKALIEINQILDKTENVESISDNSETKEG